MGELYPVDWWEFVEPEDYRRLTSPPVRPQRCVWCGGIWRHGPMCEELHRSWSMAMPFGKHRGKKVRDLPTDYLAWLVGKKQLRSDLRREVRRELCDRGIVVEFFEDGEEQLG